MMRCDIRNVAIIREAAIEVGPGITMIAGPNRSGKTVTRNAMAAALLGEYAIYGLTKHTAASIVGDHGDDALVKATWEDGSSVSVRWPPGKVIPQGNPDLSDEISCGLSTPLAWDKRGWRGFVMQAAGLDERSLRREDWETEVPAGTSADEIARDINGLGWDGAAERWAGRAKATRGKWSQLTGRRWGGNADGADTVLHWTAADDPGQLPADATSRAEALWGEIWQHEAAEKALPPDERDRLEKVAGKADRLEAKHADAVGKLQAIERQMAEHDQVYTCPHCDGKLRFDRGRPVAATAEPTHSLEQLRDMASKARDAANAIMRQMAEAQEAKGRLSSPVVQKPASDLGELKAEVEKLETQIRAREITLEAAALCKQARLENAIAEFLGPGPEGWRRAEIMPALEQLQSELARMTEAIFGEPARFDLESEDLRVVMNDLDWDRLGWKGDHSSTMLVLAACLQIIHARLTKRPCVLVDMFDTLEPAVRKRFVAAVRGVPVPIVLFCTGSPETDGLAAAGLGRTYRIDDGVVRPVK